MIVKKFTLGQYQGLSLKKENDTDRVNEIMAKVMDTSVIDFDAQALERETKATIADLTKRLEADRKNVRQYCYVHHIPSTEALYEAVKENIRMNYFEDAVLKAIADRERIAVTPEDLNEYKSNYRDRYARLERDSAAQLEADLTKVLLAKKVVDYLLEINVR